MHCGWGRRRKAIKANSVGIWNSKVSQISEMNLMRVHGLHNRNRSMSITEAAVENIDAKLIADAEALKHALHSASTFQAQAAFTWIDANEKGKEHKSDQEPPREADTLADGIVAHDGELAHKLARPGALGSRAAELLGALTAGAAA